MLQDNVWLAKKKFLSQDSSNLFDIDLIKLVVIEWGLEAAETFKDLQNLSLSVPVLYVWMLTWNVWLLIDRSLCGRLDLIFCLVLVDDSKALWTHLRSHFSDLGWQN